MIPKTGEIDLAPLQNLDVAIPMLHGPFGEDGTIQGLLEMIGIPYVGPDHRACAMCMDKILTKTLLAYHHLPTSPFLGFSEEEWHEGVEINLPFPLFVKASHLGSSIGVYRVTDRETLDQAVHDVFKIDTHVLIEQEVQGRELEFAVLGQTVFPPGEIVTEGKIYDYDAKYSEESFPTNPQAPITPEQWKRAEPLIQKAYTVTGCSIMARVDTFLDEEGNFWINEINPIPGFTEKSLYPQICRANGWDTPQLLNHLIGLAFSRKRNLDRKHAP